MNCPIINLWDKQTVLRRNFFQKKASKNLSRIKSKKTGSAKKTKYDKKCFLRVSRVSGRSWLSQRNGKHTLCTVGWTDLQFPHQCCFRRQNLVPTQVHYRTGYPDNKTRSWFNSVISTTQQSQQIRQTQALFAGANIDVINIQSLVLPYSRESKRSTNSLKRRRHFLESSDEEDLWKNSVKREANFCHSLSFWWFWHIFDSFVSTFSWLLGWIITKLR